MSFRKRLTLFFVVIVVVPMLAVALVLYLLISDSQSAKVSTRVAAAQTAAGSLYAVDQHDAGVRGAVARIFGSAGGRPGDPVLSAALGAGDVSKIRRRAAELARRQGVVRLAIYRTDPLRTVADVGDRTAVAPDTRTLRIFGQSPLTAALSVRSAAGYARIASRVTGLSVLVTQGRRLLGVGPAVSKAELDGPPATAVSDEAALAGALTRAAPRLRPHGTITVSGDRYEVGTVEAGGFDGQIVISILVPSVAGSQIAHTRLLSALILGGLLALAVVLALLVSRSLQDQIANFLGAAQRLGKGDLATRVPVTGRDEFAALGEEFNSMAGQLETRLEELRQQRRRLQRSLQRLGDSFAANLDRDAILGIVLRTAVDGSGARAGRATARSRPGEPLVESARVGPSGEFDEAMDAAEEEALRVGESGVRRVGEVSALAHVLRGSDGSTGVLGVISVARGDGDFEDGERELVAYLARQAGVSVENVGLHELVQRQAVTDELTGLFNHRRFVEALESEAERARRFNQPVGLVMVDLDDFKAVNDSYGHQQGDEVLRQVAGLMRSYSREIDAPARYGGEELAVVLPQTDLSGAGRLAERLREGIEQLEIPRVSGGGSMRVTASLGVAALPESAGDVERLIAAADAALYEAKRGGKNKTVEAR